LLTENPQSGPRSMKVVAVAAGGEGSVEGQRHRRHAAGEKVSMSRLAQALHPRPPRPHGPCLSCRPEILALARLPSVSHTDRNLSVRVRAQTQRRFSPNNIEIAYNASAGSGHWKSRLSSSPACPRAARRCHPCCCGGHCAGRPVGGGARRPQPRSPCCISARARSTPKPGTRRGCARRRARRGQSGGHAAPAPRRRRLQQARRPLVAASARGRR
jgi:hypothetical protein